MFRFDLDSGRIEMQVGDKIKWNTKSVQHSDGKEARKAYTERGMDMADAELRNTESRWNIGAGGSLPIGFGLSLAANEKSMEAFAGMNDTEKEATVEKSRQMHTRADMEQFVNSLGKGNKKKGENIK